MKKLALHIDELEVESFEVLGDAGLLGTINGRSGDVAEPAPETDPYCTAFCKTKDHLPCDTDLCNKTRQGEHTCAPIICIGFEEPQAYP